MNLNDRFAGVEDHNQEEWFYSKCFTCGAVVADKELHNEWHNEQEKKETS